MTLVASGGAPAEPPQAARVASRVEEIWYGRSLSAALLTPLSWVFQAGVAVRGHVYRSGLVTVQPLPVPVVVVGNISVGGTGKTPLVIWLSKFLRDNSFRPGIVSRGYGGHAQSWPQQVRPDSDPIMVGDEAVMLARRCECPIAVGPDRRAAAAALLKYSDCDIILSDDGLQHYGLPRDLEIAVVDGVRRFGNGRVLPAGPLREPVSRLKRVDMVVTNGIAGRGEFSMSYVPGYLHALDDEQRSVPCLQFEEKHVHAVAGIAHPQRFFSMLEGLGFKITAHAFPDHHEFEESDLQFNDSRPVIMTEKDAVKCRRYARPGHWYLPIKAELQTVFEHRFLNLLERARHGQKTA